MVPRAKRECYRIISHIGHQLVEGMGTALSHTSGISSWRGWAPCPSCRLDGHVVPGSVVFIARMWFIGTNNYRSSSAQGILP